MFKKHFTLLFFFSISHAQLPEMIENFLKEIEHEQTEEPVLKKSFEDYFKDANQAMNEGTIDQAVELYTESINLNPMCAQAYYNRGLAYQQQQKDDAVIIDEFEKAIACKPDYLKACLQLGRLYEKIDPEKAIGTYKKAIAIDPKHEQTYILLARFLAHKELFDQAAIYYKKAFNLNNENSAVMLEYANTLNTLNQTEQALELYKDLELRRPKDAGVLYNIAYTLKKLGHLDEAFSYYKKTLTVKPDHAEANFSLSLAYLTLGNYEKGWELYEWRWKRGQQLTQRNLSKPQWDGSDLTGKTILIHAEQGLGDTFQFMRYAYELKERYNCTIIFAVQKPLLNLTRDCCPYVDYAITLQDAIPVAYDVHAPLLSIPYIMKMRNEKEIPSKLPYIFVPQELTQYWRQALKSHTGFKVAICYQGNSGYSTPFLRAAVAHKSLPLEKLAPLAQIPGVKLYNIQKQTGEQQLKECPFELFIFDGDFDNSRGRFMDTAAIIENMDLVIAIDTSICHLAGALNKEVWVMLPKPADWRWLLDRDDSPWYPHNMRLFRQTEPDNWDSVISSMVHELTIRLGQPEFDDITSIDAAIKKIAQEYGIKWPLTEHEKQKIKRMYLYTKIMEL